MSTPSVRIAVFGDDHLGYAARCRTHAPSGRNQRVVDGYAALRARVDGALEAEVDLVLQTGDLFHRSAPAVADIVEARTQLERLARAGIPVVGNTGNHDASAERGKAPATAAVHDPARGIDFVTEPVRVVEPVDGLLLHVVSHYGLARGNRLLPEPVDGAVNLLTAHGAAALPGHPVFRCADSPGEQPLGPELLTDDRFALVALGHYHGMDEVLPGVWYAGSSVRRGFSDPAGGRGWLLVEVHPDGTASVQRRLIAQRPQHDLPVVDARGRSGGDVEDEVRANLAAVDLTGAIVRQVVVGASTAVRRGVDHAALARLAGPALMWMPEFRRPEPAPVPGEEAGQRPFALGTGAGDLPALYGRWVAGHSRAAGLPAPLRPVVAAEGERHLRAAAEAVGEAA